MAEEQITPLKPEDVDPPPKPVALGAACDWCKKPINAHSLVKCNMLNCPSSYQLHRSCIPLAEAKGTLMFCSLCKAKVNKFDTTRLTEALSKIPIWAQTLIVVLVISFVPQLLGDFVVPHQMAKFEGANVFARWFLRILGSWIFCIVGVIGFFIASLVVKFIRVVFTYSVRNLTQ